MIILFFATNINNFVFPFLRDIVSIKKTTSENLILKSFWDVFGLNKKFKYISVALAAAASSLIILYTAFAANFIVSDEYTLIYGGNLNKNLPYFISASDKSYLAAGSGGKLSDGVVTAQNYTQKVTLKLFGAIPIKEVNVNVVKSPLVFPSGECIGVKLYASGLITVGVVDFKTKSGETVSPAASAGIRPGDIIETLNGKKIAEISEFLKSIDKTDGECMLGIVRDDERTTVRLTPKNCEDGHRRIGVMVRDSIAGIGTLTFFEKDTKQYAALGHGISDSDTDILIPVQKGTLYKASILGITKGKKGVPGEIMGAINEDRNLGTCFLNSKTGIYGGITAETQDYDALEIAPKSRVQKGKATVICTLDDTGAHEYELEIVNINRMRNNGTKSMVIKVTDPVLLRKTGGIIQGMSGSPIIQNGRLIGAVTHVFVNDPQKGYAIFAETMFEKMNK